MAKIVDKGDGRVSCGRESIRVDARYSKSDALQLLDIRSREYDLHQINSRNLEKLRDYVAEYC